jgi:hypothetical protein
VIDPVPKTKSEGPKDSPIPLKATCAPAVLYILRKSQPASVEKEVAVMRFPMASDVGAMVHVSRRPYADGKLGERMHSLALGSTVQRPETMVKCGGGGVVYGGGGGESGGAGGGGARGGGGGGDASGGGGGAGGEEHTRQPPEVTELSEDHVIDPVPKTKSEGPKDSPYPPKELVTPAVLGMLSLSQHGSVEKKVAVMRLPMASDVGVMVHAWLMPYADGKLGERMHSLALGSVVQRPEMMVKYGGGGVTYGGGGGGGGGNASGGGGGRNARTPQSTQSMP